MILIAASNEPIESLTVHAEVAVRIVRGARWGLFGASVGVLHFAWEMSQASFFSSMKGLPAWSATRLCFRATLGDVAITAVAFLAAALLEESPLWPLHLTTRRGWLAFLLVGLTFTIAIEIWATQHQRWIYDATMPTLFGIGLLPIAQWVVVPVLEIIVFRRLWRAAGVREH